MSARTIDASGLPTVAFGYHSPLWWGQVWMAVIEGFMFALLFASYFYARLQFDAWPPPGTNHPGLVLPAINVVILILSCVPMYIGDKAALKRDWRMAKRGMSGNIALGLVFLAIQIVIWRQFEFNWKTHLYGSLIWTILGAHTMHTVASLTESTVMAVLVFLGYRKERLRLGLNVDEVYWYMVAITGVLTYIVVFFAPLVI